jgi:hypothetical protein
MEDGKHPTWNIQRPTWFVENFSLTPRFNAVIKADQAKEKPFKRFSAASTPRHPAEAGC